MSGLRPRAEANEGGPEVPAAAAAAPPPGRSPHKASDRAALSTESPIGRYATLANSSSLYSSLSQIPSASRSGGGRGGFGDTLPETPPVAVAKR